MEPEQPIQSDSDSNSQEEEAYLDPEDVQQVIEFDNDEEPMDSSSGSNDDEKVDEDIVDLSLRKFVAHNGEIYSVAFNKVNPNMFASGGGDDCAMVWDLSSPSVDPVHVLKGHTDSVSHLSFSSDGKLLSTCGLDAVLKIWDPLTGQLLHSLEGPSESVEVLSRRFLHCFSSFFSAVHGILKVQLFLREEGMEQDGCGKQSLDK